MPKDILGTTFYTTKEVSDALQISRMTLRKYIDEGRINAHQIGRGFLITEQDLVEFVKKNSRVDPN